MKWKFLLFFSLLPLPFLPGQSPDIRWEPREELVTLLAESPAQTKFSWTEAFKTALILEEIPPEKVDSYWKKLDGLMEEISNNLDMGLPAEQKADLLLQLLHQSSLKKYETLQTRLSVLLDKGTFNCVSSALIYGILASRLGLEVSYVGTRDHAFCVVNLGDRKVDVETTTPLGFDPGKKREFQDAFGKTTGFAYVPAPQYSRRFPLKFQGLLGLLIQNLVAEAQLSGDVFKPLGLAWDRKALEQTEESDEFLLQVFKNLAAHRNERKQYRLALDEVFRMKTLLGDHSTLKDIARSMANNQLVLYFDRQEWGTAREFLQERKSELGSLASTWQNNLDVGESKAVFAQGGFSALLTWTESRKNFLSQEQRLILEENFLLQSASPLMNQKKWSEITLLTGQLSQELLSRPKVRKLLETLHYNQTVDIHNQFAALMNQKDYVQARKLLEKALLEFPQSDILLQDRTRLPPE